MIQDPVPSNATEWSVSELAGALRRTIEDAFGFVRLRGEVSGYRGPSASGHVYFSIKDANAKIDAVVWKGAFARLKIRPEEGLEVIATGKITTFAGKSSYQIVVESLEPAGVGALMALLEERRRKLAAEGLFDPARKRRLPYLPGVVGVVTSPTGAVIRDILHRLEDRFPRRVLVWPVRVQGDASAAEVAAGIRGFNGLEEGGAIPRPDVIIVARGGGSIEDLWGFNDEAVVRAVAESAIPLVSAVGHETDTTLIDHVADLRAPTPTGAAEMVVPVRAELLAVVGDLSRRHGEAMLRFVDHRRHELRSVARALPKADELFSEQQRRLDLAGAKLLPGLDRSIRTSETRLAKAVTLLARHSPTTRLATARARLVAIDHRPREALHRYVASRRDLLEQRGKRLSAARDALVRAERLRLQQRGERTAASAQRLGTAARTALERKRNRLETLCQLFDSVNYKSVLARGFALVRDEQGQPLRKAAAVPPGRALALEFADGSVRATAEGAPANATDAPRLIRPARPRPVASAAGIVQGSLFDA